MSASFVFIGVEGPLDYARIGRNLRGFRQLRGKGQAEIAAAAGISVRTLFRVERGASARLGTLSRICGALGCDLAEVTTSERLVRSRKAEQPFLLHTREQTVWYAVGDRRKRVPEDSQRRIQSEAERHRLGHQGLVAMFVSAPSFTMPQGPGVALFELYGPHSTPYPFLYHDLLFVCLRGEVTFTIDGERVRVHAGEAINPGPYDVHYEPSGPVGRDGVAPLLLHVGGARLTPYSPPGEDERMPRGNLGA